MGTVFACLLHSVFCQVFLKPGIDRIAGLSRVIGCIFFRQKFLEALFDLGILRITREIPVRSTLWTMSWPDGDRFARDRFYLWLLERIDRWDEWSEMVSRDGARALTEHFMKLAFCDRFVAEGFAGFDGL